MNILIRVRVDSLTLARLVIYYQQNGVVPKSSNALINTALRDYIKALEHHGLLPNIPDGRDVEILKAAGYIGDDPQGVDANLSKSAVLPSSNVPKDTSLAATIAGRVGRKEKQGGKKTSNSTD